MDKTVITFSAENTFTICAMVALMFTLLGLVGKVVRKSQAGNN